MACCAKFQAFHRHSPNCPEVTGRNQRPSDSLPTVGHVRVTFGGATTGPGVRSDGRDKVRPGGVKVDQWQVGDDCRLSGLDGFTIEVNEFDNLGNPKKTQRR